MGASCLEEHLRGHCELRKVHDIRFLLFEDSLEGAAMDISGWTVDENVLIGDCASLVALVDRLDVLEDYFRLLYVFLIDTVFELR